MLISVIFTCACRRCAQFDVNIIERSEQKTLVGAQSTQVLNTVRSKLVALRLHSTLPGCMHSSYSDSTELGRPSDTILLTDCNACREESAVERLQCSAAMDGEVMTTGSPCL